VLLPEQGLAILRDGDRYASLECGAYGGGHGHPDRLHLTLHAGGVHWLADPGTGSYVSPSLFWYRSTLAHNAPRVDSVSQPLADARAEVFDVAGRWGWARGRCEKLTRTVVCGSAHLVDVMEFADDQEHLVELPWHPEGEVKIVTPGRWEPDELPDEFATGAERFVPAGQGPIAWRATVGSRTLLGFFDAAGELIRARGPARPGQGGDQPFFLRRQRGRYVRFAAVLGFAEPVVTGVRFASGEITVETAAGTVVHRQSSEGWEVEDVGTRASLRGLRRQALAVDLPAIGQERVKYTPPEAIAHHVVEAPALDGTLAGFVEEDPLSLDHEDQYRRSEEAYPGPEAFAAHAWLAWDETALFIAVSVGKGNLTFRAVGDPPLRLDNEVDLIHSDGIQVYLQLEGQPRLGVLVVPDPASGALQIHHVGGTSADGVTVRGAWRRTEDGYLVTVAISSPGWPPGANDPAPRFDLIVNEMRPGRARRPGQLVWTGGGGWVYLRGDRQDPGRAGRLLLA
jgi:hypothetical protein